MTFNAYAAGKKVYKGGTNAPNVGMLPKTGYVDRNNNNFGAKVAIGMANAAQAKLASAATKTANATPLMTAASKAAAPRATGALSGGSAGYGSIDSILAGTKPSTPVAATSTGSLAPISGGAAAYTPVAAPTAPTAVGATPPGVYTAPTTPTSVANPAPTATVGTSTPGETALPFDYTSALNQGQLDAQKAAYENQLNIAKQAEQLGYTNADRDLNLQHPTDERNLLNTAAARGMAQSSGYGYNYGQLQDQFQRNLSDLAAKHAAALDAFTSQSNTYDQSYANQTAINKQQQAAAAAALAGTLGLKPVTDTTPAADTTAPAATPTGPAFTPPVPGSGILLPNPANLSTTPMQVTGGTPQSTPLSPQQTQQVLNASQTPGSWLSTLGGFGGAALNAEASATAKKDPSSADGLYHYGYGAAHPWRKGDPVIAPGKSWGDYFHSDGRRK